MDKHSPTPWRVMKAYDDEPARIIDADDYEVAIELIDPDAALIVEAVNKYESMALDLADERSRSDRLLQQLSNEASDNARLRDELRQETEAANRYFEAASAATAAYNNLRNIVRGLVAILDTITIEDHEIALLDEAREAVKEEKP
jgi:hypothetical protein